MYTYCYGKALLRLPSDLKIKAFADDSHLTVPLPYDLSTVFNTIANALTTAGLKLNLNKCVVVINPKNVNKIINAPEQVQITFSSQKLLGIPYGYKGIDYKALALARSAATAFNKHKLMLIGYFALNVNTKLSWFICFIKPTILFGAGLLNENKYGCKTPICTITKLFTRELKMALGVMSWCPIWICYSLTQQCYPQDQIRLLNHKMNYHFQFMNIYLTDPNNLINIESRYYFKPKCKTVLDESELLFLKLFRNMKKTTNTLIECPYCGETDKSSIHPLHLIKCAFVTAIYNEKAVTLPSTIKNLHWINKGLIDNTGQQYQGYVRFYTDASIKYSLAAPLAGIGIVKLTPNFLPIESQYITKYPYKCSFRVELLAVINTILYDVQLNVNTIIFTDNKEVVELFTNLLKTITHYDNIIQNWDIISTVYTLDRSKLQILLVEGHSKDLFNSRADYLSKSSRMYLQQSTRHTLPLENIINEPLLIFPPVFNLQNLFNLITIKDLDDIEGYLDLLNNHIESHIQYSLNNR